MGTGKADDATQLLQGGNMLGGTSGSGGEPMDIQTATDVLEHLLREVITAEDFGEIIDQMITQDTPFFLQFEDSAPPGNPDAQRKPTLAAITGAAADDAGASADPDAAQAYKERMEKLSKDLDRPEPKWTSALLMNFEDMKPVRGIPPSDAPIDFPEDDEDEDEEGEEEEQDETQEKEKEQEVELDPEKLWDDTLGEYGEVDLDTFKSSVAEVLEDMLLSTMDDVIGGRFNWTRPMPRAKKK